MGRLVEVADTRLHVEERGKPSGFPLLVFHGGPGLEPHVVRRLSRSAHRDGPLPPGAGRQFLDHITDDAG
jgi:hypothetical protein